MNSINLKHDFKEILQEELDNNKIIYNDNNDLFEFMVMYYDAIMRIPIIGEKYNVVFSEYLNRKFSSLPIETQECINDIVNRLKCGKSITTYLSKLALNASTRDNEFQNWNIYHAHVKRISLDYNEPAERSNLLLFFTVKGENVYFIDVKNHPKGDGWFDKLLIEIIYDNWKELLNVVEGATGLKGELPDNKVHKISQTMGILVTVRGKIIMPTNIGNTTAGNSINSTRWALKWRKDLNDLEEKVKKNLNIIKNNIEKELGKKIEKPLDIHLVKRDDGNFVLYEKKFNKYIKLRS